MEDLEGTSVDPFNWTMTVQMNALVDMFDAIPTDLRRSTIDSMVFKLCKQIFLIELSTSSGNMIPNITNDEMHSIGQHSTPIITILTSCRRGLEPRQMF